MAGFDLAIIGGGINGAAIGRDAAGRGLSVLLVEQNDLGSGTSSASTKLIHGGLRYLEHYAFKLVHEALRERTLLLKMAPHVIRPARFVLPHHEGLRPAWQLRLGLLLYDIFGGKSILPPTHTIDLTTGPAGAPLQDSFRTGFEYSDCCVDDARFVVLNAIDAAERGAAIRTRTRFEKAQRQNGEWHLALNAQGRPETVTAKALVNATGPWIEETNKAMPGDIRRSSVNLVKGSHIVVPRLFEHDKAYIFQNADGRIVFAIPYEKNFTLIGTTDYDFTGDPKRAAASPEEITYLCRVASGYFKKPVAEKDVVWSFAGVRALYDARTTDAQKLSRDYFLELDTGNGKAPLLSVYGGKLTAARHLAEMAVQRLSPFFVLSAPWTARAPLPGGDFPWSGLDALIEQTRAQWPFLNEAHATRLVRSYGTRTSMIMGSAVSMDDLGGNLGGDLTEREVLYLMRHEWAETADDVLWRRSKLGLHLTRAAQETLARFMAGNRDKA